MGVEQLFGEMMIAGLLAMVSLALLGFNRKARKPAWIALRLGALGALLVTVAFAVEGLPHPTHAMLWFLVFAFPATAVSSFIVLVAMAIRAVCTARAGPKHVA